MDGLLTSLGLIFLASSKLYRLRVTIPTNEAKKTTYICLFLTFVYLSLSLLQFMNLISFYVNDIIAMVFILIYNDSIRRAGMRMYQIALESVEVIVIFLCALVLFSCLSRVIFFDFNELYETKENYSAFNFSSFSQSFYTMIVAVSTTNFPMAMLKAYA